MKRALVSGFLMALFLTILAHAKGAEKGGAEQAIAGLEQKWADALKASNPDVVAPLLAFSFVDTDSDGKMAGKEETLAHIKAGKWETSEVSDVKVVLYGKIAIATGVWVGKGTDASGNAIDTRERWTDTWVKIFGGNWQCVASHSSRTKM
jgi:ketosteroid isomerase-like protein